MDFLDFVRALQRPDEYVPDTIERVQSLYHSLRRNSPRLWQTIVNCGRQKRLSETSGTECHLDRVMDKIDLEQRRELQRVRRETKLIQGHEELGQIFVHSPAPPSPLKQRRFT